MNMVNVELVPVELVKKKRFLHEGPLSISYLVYFTKSKYYQICIILDLLYLVLNM